MKTPQRHSNTVGGSTAARVIACPGSVRLCQTCAKSKPTDATRQGSMLHAAAAIVIEECSHPQDMLGFEFEGVKLTQELIDDKLEPAIDMFDAIIIDLEEKYSDTAEIHVEKEVTFGDYIPDAFGSADIVARVGPRAIVHDWKFGDGKLVYAENNMQALFYAAAAARTHELKHLFKDVKEVEAIIIQPRQGEPSRWVFEPDRLTMFERELKSALKEAEKPDAYLFQGDHCTWCPAAATCPLLCGAMETALKIDLQQFDPSILGKICEETYLLEGFIDAVRKRVQESLENGVAVPGWKLVMKRAIRNWSTTDDVIEKKLVKLGLSVDDLYKTDIVSPAAAEKLLKKLKIDVPEELIKKESSGTTLAPEKDTREPVQGVVQLGSRLKKLQGAK